MAWVQDIKKQLIQFIQHMTLNTDIVTNLTTPLNQAMSLDTDNNPPKILVVK